MINMCRVVAVLDEVRELIEGMDGVDLDERSAIDDAPGAARRERAQQSQMLNLIGDRLAYAESLVRVQYWSARGHADPTLVDRDQE